MNTDAKPAVNQHLGHLGHFFAIPMHREKEFNFGNGEKEKNINNGVLKGMAEKCPKRPNFPSLPDLSPLIRSLEFGDPNFCEPQDGALVIGLYRDESQAVTPVMLWADPEVDLFWDIVARRHVKPPRFYIHLWNHCRFDPKTGHPIIDGAECPF